MTVCHCLCVWVAFKTNQTASGSICFIFFLNKRFYYNIHVLLFDARFCLHEFNLSCIKCVWHSVRFHRMGIDSKYNSNPILLFVYFSNRKKHTIRIVWSYFCCELLKDKNHLRSVQERFNWFQNYATTCREHQTEKKNKWLQNRHFIGEYHYNVCITFH